MNWSESPVTSPVRFPHLAPAHYRFEVRSMGESGQVSAPAFVEFRLLPPVWQRGWFIAALLALTTAAGYALHHYRLNQLLAVQRVRTRLATDLHDDLGAGLAEIAILSEVAKRKPADAAAEVLEYTANRARSLRAALGDIVWTVDPRCDRLSDLVRRMRQTALPMLEIEDRRVEFIAPDDKVLEATELSPQLRRHLLLFFKEAVANTARHSGASDVRLEIALAARQVRISIHDNGRGFDPAMPTDGHGLTSLRYRTAEMHGELRLDSAPGRGTQIELRAPL